MIYRDKLTRKELAALEQKNNEYKDYVQYKIWPKFKKENQPIYAEVAKKYNCQLDVYNQKEFMDYVHNDENIERFSRRTLYVYDSMDIPVYEDISPYAIVDYSTIPLKDAIEHFALVVRKGIAKPNQNINWQRLAKQTLFKLSLETTVRLFGGRMRTVVDEISCTMHDDPKAIKRLTPTMLKPVISLARNIVLHGADATYDALNAAIKYKSSFAYKPIYKYIEDAGCYDYSELEDIDEKCIVVKDLVDEVQSYLKQKDFDPDFATKSLVFTESPKYYDLDVSLEVEV